MKLNNLATAALLSLCLVAPLSALCLVGCDKQEQQPPLEWSGIEADTISVWITKSFDTSKGLPLDAIAAACPTPKVPKCAHPLVSKYMSVDFKGQKIEALVSEPLSFTCFNTYIVETCSPQDQRKLYADNMTENSDVLQQWLKYQLIQKAATSYAH